MTSREGGNRAVAAATCCDLKVVAVIRPLLDSERREGCNSAVRAHDEGDGSGIVTIPSLQGSFKFDGVYDSSCISTSPAALSESLYKQTLEPVVESLFTGYNCTVFAYGQTGAGKSFTMGTSSTSNSKNEQVLHSAKGTMKGPTDTCWIPMMPRVANQVAEGARKLVEAGVNVSLTCSFFEIYQDRVRDLLGANHTESASSTHLIGLPGRWRTEGFKAPTGCQSPRAGSDRSRVGNLRVGSDGIQIRDPDPNKEVILQGLEEVKVLDASSILACLADGLKRRSTAATNTNAHSSRSHALFLLRLLQERGAAPTTVGATLTTTLTSQLYLVDLAGSESLQRSLAEGQRLQEACSINSGLLALGNVIEALADPSRTHVPYRDHKLTRILRHALGGNSRTVMLACLSPADLDLAESLNTLRYATRARMIKNMPLQNSSSKSGAAATLANTVAENTALRYQVEKLEVDLEGKQTAWDRERESLMDLVKQLQRELARMEGSDKQDGDKSVRWCIKCGAAMEPAENGECSVRKCMKCGEEQPTENGESLDEKGGSTVGYLKAMFPGMSREGEGKSEGDECGGPLKIIQSAEVLQNVEAAAAAAKYAAMYQQLQNLAEREAAALQSAAAAAALASTLERELEEARSELTIERAGSLAAKAKCSALTSRVRETLQVNAQLEQQLREVREIAVQQLIAAGASLEDGDGDGGECGVVQSYDKQTAPPCDVQRPSCLPEGEGSQQVPHQEEGAQSQSQEVDNAGEQQQEQQQQQQQQGQRTSLATLMGAAFYSRGGLLGAPDGLIIPHISQSTKLRSSHSCVSATTDVDEGSALRREITRLVLERAATSVTAKQSESSLCTSTQASAAHPHHLHTGIEGTAARTSYVSCHGSWGSTIPVQSVYSKDRGLHHKMSSALLRAASSNICYSNQLYTMNGQSCIPPGVSYNGRVTVSGIHGLSSHQSSESCKDRAAQQQQQQQHSTSHSPACKKTAAAEEGVTLASHTPSSGQVLMESTVQGQEVMVMPESSLMSVIRIENRTHSIELVASGVKNARDRLMDVHEDGGRSPSTSLEATMMFIEACESKASVQDRVAALEQSWASKELYHRQQEAVQARKALDSLGAVSALQWDSSSLGDGADCGRDLTLASEVISGDRKLTASLLPYGELMPNKELLGSFDAERWILSFTQDCELQSLIECERATRAALQRQLEDVENELKEVGHDKGAALLRRSQSGAEDTEDSQQMSARGATAPEEEEEGERVTIEAHLGHADLACYEAEKGREGTTHSSADLSLSAAAAGLVSRQALLLQRSKQRGERLEALLLLKSRCMQSVDVVMRSALTREATGCVTELSTALVTREATGCVTELSTALEAESNTKTLKSSSRSLIDESARSGYVGTVMLSGDIISPLQQPSINPQVMELLILAVGLRRRVKELQTQLMKAESQLELRGQKEEVYRIESSELAIQVQLLMQHVQELEASNTKLGVLTAQRHEAVSLMVNARLLQADLEEELRQAKDEIEETKAELLAIRQSLPSASLGVQRKSLEESNSRLMSSNKSVTTGNNSAGLEMASRVLALNQTWIGSELFWPASSHGAAQKMTGLDDEKKPQQHLWKSVNNAGTATAEVSSCLQCSESSVNKHEPCPELSLCSNGSPESICNQKGSPIGKSPAQKPFFRYGSSFNASWSEGSRRTNGSQRLRRSVDEPVQNNGLVASGKPQQRAGSPSRPCCCDNPSRPCCCDNPSQSLGDESARSSAASLAASLATSVHTSCANVEDSPPDVAGKNSWKSRLRRLSLPFYSSPVKK
ncbi:hypothetical protein CEUSTIGMA_g9780.t1 [Chlamydomonas eustigma]|uniref:Kinesin motor domain-containing protein n=1 Tax=Chlamydomonas eustigma TaxID=1157962 RepID=A0A250XGZ7_9CHLO|nr:hypothetical protein CEUSTIGMA_g9780.t1 [Chlamydomonas eustigma]|eukprot:GAX82351.1 hypothetical protein CEUSTIGMA_g9780.t1 [Chlamydomonas eustigma]